MSCILKTIYFYRHPEVLRPNNICAGQLDLALALNWKENVKHWTNPHNKIKVISSPLSRCLLPAQLCFKSLNIASEISERNFGIWEGKSWDQISREQIDLWQSDPLHFKTPEGESTFEMKNRIKNFILRQQDSEQIWISHQGVFRILKSFFVENALESDLDSTIEYTQLKTLLLDPKKLN